MPRRHAAAVAFLAPSRPHATQRLSCSASLSKCRARPLRSSSFVVPLRRRLNAAPCTNARDKHHSTDNNSDDSRHAKHIHQSGFLIIRLSLDAADEGASSQSDADPDSSSASSAATSSSSSSPSGDLAAVGAAAGQAGAELPSESLTVTEEEEASGDAGGETSSSSSSTGGDREPNAEKDEDAAPKRSLLQSLLAFLKRCFAPPGFLVGLFTGVTFAFVIIFVPSPGSRDALLRQKVTLFDVILHDIDESYVEKIDINRLFENGINSMLGSLDPYTQFENNAQAMEMSVKTNGRYAGVGLGLTLGEPGMGKRLSPAPATDQPDNSSNNSNSNNNNVDISKNSNNVSMNDSLSNAAKAATSERRDKETDPATDTQAAKDKDKDKDKDKEKEKEKDKDSEELTRPIVVMSAFEGYAFDAGVRPGDIIQSVEGKPVTGVSLEKVTEMLRGEPGTEVVVGVAREGFASPLSFRLSRKDVQIRDVPAYAFVGDASDGVAYIRLQSFAKDAAAEVAAALDALEEQHAIRSVILDVRGNPGGLLNAAIEVAELFVPRGQTIVTTKGRGLDAATPSYQSSRDPRVSAARTRVAVLVNGQTASASEIVAGAIQDLDLGVVVGSRTFGKGLVQNVQELPFNTALKFTVGKYYTPSGRCIQSYEYAQADGDSAQFSTSPVKESARRAFRTSGGRVVRDGGGIEPDVAVPMRPSSLELALHKQQLYFRYASRFAAKHAHGLDYTLPDDFFVTDATYRDFVKFAADSDFKYESRFDDSFDDLDDMLRDFGYPAARARLKDLRAATHAEMRADFVRHEQSIRAQLESAIRFRFQPDSKRIVADLRNDQQLVRTVALLKDDVAYANLLKGPPDWVPKAQAPAQSDKDSSKSDDVKQKQVKPAAPLQKETQQQEEEDFDSDSSSTTTTMMNEYTTKRSNHTTTTTTAAEAAAAAERPRKH